MGDPHGWNKAIEKLAATPEREPPPTRDWCANCPHPAVEHIGYGTTKEYGACLNEGCPCAELRISTTRPATPESEPPPKWVPASPGREWFEADQARKQAASTVAPPLGHSLYGMALVHCVACGWSGEVKDLRPDSRACPNCGTTGGLEFGERPAVAPPLGHRCAEIRESVERLRANYVTPAERTPYHPAKVAEDIENAIARLDQQDTEIARLVEQGDKYYRNWKECMERNHAELSRLETENERLDGEVFTETLRATEAENGEEKLRQENAALRAQVENLLTPEEAHYHCYAAHQANTCAECDSVRAKLRRIAGGQP